MKIKLPNLRLTIGALLTLGMSLSSASQSNHTVTFSGSTSNFNAAEKISAAAGSTDYYITFDASNLYIGAFRTSGTFATSDNLTIYLDTDPNSTPTSSSGTTTGQTYNGVTATLPFSANYNVYAEESFQEARSEAGSWASTISGLTYSAGSTWREVAIPFSSIGNPNALYISMWIGQAGTIYSNVPGSDLGGGANPNVTEFIGGFGVSSADCIPVNTINRPITALLSNAAPASGITYGKVSISSGSIVANNNFNIASGGSIQVSGGSFDISDRSIILGGTTAGAGGGTTINHSGGTIVTDDETELTFNGEGLMSGSSFTYNGEIRINRKFTPLTAGGTILGNNASIDLRANSFINSNAIVYNAGSTLMYNTGTTTTAGVEWTANSTNANGVPSNVVIGNNVANTVVSFGTSSQYRHANGSITISNSTAGNGLTLSSVSGGDLQLTGNFTQNGTFTHNSRLVTFNGNTAQSISGTLNTSGSTNNFAYLVINNTNASGVTLNSNARISTASGDVLRILNTGRLNIAGSTTLLLDGAGGNILVSGGARTIRFDAANAILNITGTKTVTTASGGTLSFTSVSSYGTVALSAAVNFGSALTTLGNNTHLQINSGGSVTTNSPTYSAGSTLNYNTGAAVNRNTEWNSNNPHHVLISTSGTNLNLPNGVNGTTRTCAGNLTINDGCTLSMGAMTVAFTVGGDVNIGNGSSGTLTLSSASGGNLNVGGDFTKNSGTFTPNARTITLNGTSAQTFSSNSSESISTLIVSNTSGLVSLNSSLSITSAITFNSNSNSVIGSAATITLSDGDTFTGNNSGSVITVNGVLRNTGGATGATITSNASTLVFGSTGTYDHNMTRTGVAASGTSLGTIPTATWNAGSTVLISGLTNPTSGGWFGGATQTLSNFVWNTPAMSTDPNMAGANLVANGAFTITSLNGRTIRMSTSGANGSITCGDYSQANGTLSLNAGSTGSGTINCSGDFNLSAGTITETGTGTAHLINFNGSSQQNLTFASSPANDINYTFNNTNGFVLNSAITIANNRTVTRSRGTFSGAGSIAYGTGTNLIYDTSSALTSSNYEWPSTSGPINVTINKSGGVTLHAARTVSGVLTMTAGVLELGSNNLTISNNSTSAITGTYSVTNMIAASGSGQLIRAINTGANTYVFPIGDVTGTDEYSPVSIAFSANSTARNLGVIVVDGNHPQLNTSPTQTDYISRYWQFSNSAAGTYTYTGTFTYVAADVTGSVSNIRANMYNGSSWTQAAASNSASNVLSITSNETNSSLPFGATAQFTGRVNNGTTYTWNQTGTSSFATTTNWTPTRSTPRVDDILVFSNGATTTATGVTNQTIGKLLISGNTTVTLQSGSDQTLTIGGGNGDDLDIDSGSNLRIGSTGNNALTISYSNVTTTTIDGGLSLLANNGFDNAINFTNSSATVNGSLSSAGLITSTALNLDFTSGSSYNHNFTTTAGNIPVAAWSTTSTCSILGYTTNTAAPGNRSQSFGHFTWNCTSQSETIQLDGGLTTINGNFTVSSTGSGGDELRLNDDTNYILNIGGNFSNSGADIRLTDSNGTYTATVNVGGNYSQSGSGSTFIMNNGNNSTTSRLFVEGNFTLSAGSITQPSGGTNNNLIEFNGTSLQAISISGTLPSSGQQMNYRFNNSAGFTLSGTIPVNNASTLYRKLGSISGGTISYNSTGSTLAYEGTTAMTTGVEFPSSNGPEDVSINSTSVITLSASRSLPSGGIFTCSNGVFVLGANDLTLLNPTAGALINYSPSASRMIAADGAGQLRRAIPNAAIDLYFYIGDVTGTPEYSALRLNFSANSVNNRIVGVRLVQDTSSNLSLPYAPIDYLNRHWIVTLSSTSGSYSYIPTLTYTAGDVTGTENNLQVAAFPSGASAWNHYSTTISSSTLIKSGAALTQANFSLNNAQISGRTPVKYWDGSESTAWNDTDNWTPSGVPNSSDNIDFNGNAASPCILTGSATVNHLTLSDGGDLTLASGASLTVGGNFTHNPSAATSFDCNSTLTLSNTTFNQFVPAISYGNLNLGSGARTLDNAGTINICGNYTPTSGALTFAGSSVDFVGTTTQSILTNSTSFDNLTISNTSANVNSASSFSVTGAMTIIPSARLNNSAGTLTISSGATGTVSGYLRNRGTVTTTGSLTFTSSGTYEHDFTSSEGTIPSSTWQSGSTCLIRGYTSNNDTPSGLNQAFHHFTWDCSNQDDNINLNGGLSTINGDLTIADTGTGQLRLTGNTDETTTVGGNFVQTDGELILVSGNGDIYINVAGDYIQTGGYVDFMLSNTGYGEVIISGNYNRTGSGVVITTGLSPNGVFRFNGTNQTITESSSGNVKWIDFEINSGSTTTLLTDLPLNGTSDYISTITPLSGGILDCGTNLITNTGTTRVNVPNGGTIRTAHVDGLATSGATGTVRTSSRVYNSGGTYVFNGSSNQNTGNFFTSTSTANTVANLVIANTATTVTLNSGTNPTVTNSLSFTSDNTANFNVGAQTIYVSNTSTSAVTRAGSGHVIGNLRRAFSTGTNTYVFHVGGATNYAPASLALVASTAGSLTVKTTDGVHPNAATDGMSQTSYINRYWTVTANSGTLTSNASTFTYAAGDIVGGATTETLRLKRYSAGWTAPAYTSVGANLTATTLTNTTTYGDFFAAADCSGYTATITPSASTTICNGGSVDLAATTNITGSTYVWSPGTGLSSTTAATPTASPSSTITYTVTATSPQNCVDTETVTVTVNPRPTSVITGTTTICNGGSTNLSIALTGTGPWSGTLSNGASFSGASSPITVSVSPSSATTYTVATLSDANCNSILADRTGSAVISVNTRPTGVITGTTAICAGESTNLSIALSGAGPWSGTLSNGASFSGASSPITVSVSPSSTITYTIATLTDANCNSISGDLTGSAIVTVNPLPTAYVIADGTFCYGDSTLVIFGGTPNATITYDINGGADQTAVIGVSGTVEINTSALTVDLTYNLLNVDNGTCDQDLSESSTVYVHDQLIASISGTDNICDGSSTDIIFAGSPNATVVYTINGGANQNILLDGSGDATLNTGSVFENVRTYALVSVILDECSRNVSGSAIITTLELPEATISGATSICSGLNTNITFNGNPGATVTYDINGGSDLTAVLNGSGVAVVNTGAIVSNTTYELLSIDNGTCTQDINSTVTVTVFSNEYFEDTDGDGFGDPLSSVFGCTAPMGYVANSLDCDDSDSSINPNTVWYADIDNDGFGSSVYLTQCEDPMIAGVVQIGGDCDDDDNTIYPGSTEICANGIDDDCDGFIDEGCDPAPSNDSWSNALTIPVSGNVYPYCQPYAGTTIGATVSPQSSPSGVVTGEDVWFKFQTNSAGVRVNLTNAAFDGVVELYSSLGVLIDHENVTGFSGNENLNIGTLTAGTWYYVAVRNYNSALGAGTFNLCLQRLSGGACASGGGVLELCSNFKPAWTGANQYITTFTSVPGGVVTSHTSTGQFPLSVADAALQFSTTYSTSVAAVYNLTNGAGASEVITVPSVSNCTFSVGAQPDVQVKETQICPATVFRNSLLQYKPFVCGAVDFELRFTRVDINNIPIALPFTILRGAPVSTLHLSFGGPNQLVNGGRYIVEVRPIMPSGPGIYGTPQCITLAGAAMADTESSPNLNDQTKSELLNEGDLIIYPNPTNGEMINLSIENSNVSNVEVRIFDSVGKMIKSSRFGIDGQLNTEIHFETTLTNGLYTIEFRLDDGSIASKRFMVSR